MLLTPTHLLSSENCPPHLTPLTSPLHHQHLHSSTKLSHLVGDLDDSGQGLKGEGMQTFLDRMIWADPSLVFLSLLPSSGEG